MIRQATLHDLDAIYAVADKVRYRQDAQLGEDEGFLLQPFTREDMASHIELADVFWVYEVDGEIQAYLSGFFWQTMKAITTDAVRAALLAYYKGDFVLVKHICVNKNGKHRHGAAKALYDELFTHYPQHGVIAPIALSPLNMRSVRFHEERGFRRGLSWSVMGSDGVYRPFGYWSKKVSVDK